MINFGDPKFQYHQAIAQFWGLVSLRLADARVLPFNVSDYSAAISAYILEAEKLATAQNISLDFSSLQSAFRDSFAPAAMAVDMLQQIFISNTSAPSDEVLKLNQRLFMLERSFLTSDGLPARTWYKHWLVAPGVDQGYSAEVLPALMAALRSGDAVGAQSAADVLADVLQTAAINLVQPF